MNGNLPTPNSSRASGLLLPYLCVTYYRFYRSTSNPWQYRDNSGWS